MRYVAFYITLIYEVRQQILAAAVVHVFEAQSSESLQQDICSNACISAGQIATQACWPGSFQLRRLDHTAASRTQGWAWESCTRW